jgi:hypothetical protein
VYDGDRIAFVIEEKGPNGEDSLFKLYINGQIRYKNEINKDFSRHKKGVKLTHNRIEQLVETMKEEEKENEEKVKELRRLKMEKFNEFKKLYPNYRQKNAYNSLEYKQKKKEIIDLSRRLLDTASKTISGKQRIKLFSKQEKPEEKQEKLAKMRKELPSYEFVPAATFYAQDSSHTISNSYFIDKRQVTFTGKTIGPNKAFLDALEDMESSKKVIDGMRSNYKYAQGNECRLFADLIRDTTTASNFLEVLSSKLRANKLSSRQNGETCSPRVMDFKDAEVTNGMALQGVEGNKGEDSFFEKFNCGIKTKVAFFVEKKDGTNVPVEKYAKRPFKIVSDPNSLYGFVVKLDCGNNNELCKCKDQKFTLKGEFDLGAVEDERDEGEKLGKGEVTIDVTITGTELEYKVCGNLYEYKKDENNNYQCVYGERKCSTARRRRLLRKSGMGC